MAEQGLFGPTPEQLAELRRQQEQERVALAGRVSPSYSVGYGLGSLLTGVVGRLFNLQDPAIERASKIQAALKEVNSSLTDEERANPALQYARVAQRFAQEDGLQNEAMKAQQMAAELGFDYEQRQADIAAKRATALKAQQDAMLKQQDYLREEQGRAALLKAAETKGSALSNEETIQVLSAYLPPEKLVPLLQTSQDKAAYRDAMLQQANIMADSRIAAAEARNANQKELEEIRQQNRRELEVLKSQLNPKAGAGAKVSVYERGYANQFVTSANELVPASQNLNILTNGGTSPVTAGMFSGLKGNGFLTSTGSALGNTMTNSDSLQYESIMLPVIQNIGTIQNAGRRTTIAQLDNLKQALIAKPGQSYLAQLQKMGELRQIVEAAAEAAKDNPALSDEQKAQVQSSVAKLGQFIPFTGTDVTKFSVYAKKNPNVPFKDWLKVNGSQAGQTEGKSVVRSGTVTAGPNKGKTVVEYSDGTREYK
jgi:hypothetical protein